MYTPRPPASGKSPQGRANPKSRFLQNTSPISADLREDKQCEYDTSSTSRLSTSSFDEEDVDSKATSPKFQSTAPSLQLPSPMLQSSSKSNTESPIKRDFKHNSGAKLAPQSPSLMQSLDSLVPLPPSAYPRPPTSPSDLEHSSLDALLDHLSSPQIVEENMKKLLSLPENTIYTPAWLSSTKPSFADSDANISMLIEAERSVLSNAQANWNSKSESKVSARPEVESRFESERKSAKGEDEDEDEQKISAFLNKQTESDLAESRIAVSEIASLIRGSVGVSEDDWSDPPTHTSTSTGTTSLSTSTSTTPTYYSNNTYYLKTHTTSTPSTSAPHTSTSTPTTGIIYTGILAGRKNQDRSYMGVAHSLAALNMVDNDSKSEIPIEKVTENVEIESGIGISVSESDRENWYDDDDTADTKTTPSLIAPYPIYSSVNATSVDNSEKPELRCAQLMVGGSRSVRGVRSSVFSKTICNHLICLQCNFRYGSSPIPLTPIPEPHT